MKAVTKKLLVAKVPQWVISLIYRIGCLARLPIQRYPLYRGGCLDTQPVFIFGCGRSGNTLLRSMLTAGDELAIPPESYVIPKVIRIFQAYNFLPWEQLCSLIIGEFQSYKEFYTWSTDLSKAAIKVRNLPASKRTLANLIDLIYREYSIQAGFKGDIWGDKTPINSIYSGRILKVFPEAKYIHLIRDPRAVAVSYRESKLYPDLESGIRFWMAANKNIFKYRNKVNMINISYEELVVQPEISLRRICKGCNIRFSMQMIEHYSKFERLGDTLVHAHHQNAGKKITSEFKDKWKEKVSEEDLEKMNALLKDITESYYV